jgi:hypothetical protein
MGSTLKVMYSRRHEKEIYLCPCLSCHHHDLSHEQGERILN